MHLPNLQSLAHRTLLLIGASVALLLASFVLLREHAVSMQKLREAGLPAAAELPALQRRLATLSEQVEVADLQQQLHGGGARELLDLYVIPSEPSFDRLLGFFESVRDGLARAGHLSAFSAVTIGEVVAADDGLAAYPVSFETTVTDEGFAQLIIALEAAGSLTVSDTLGTANVQSLMQLTEDESPAGLPALEQFLSSDLLRYARDPRAAELQVLRSFPSDAFQQTFRSVIERSLLGSVRTMLSGPVGEQLVGRSLWPLRLLTVERVTVESAGRMWNVSVRATAYTR